MYLVNKLRPLLATTVLVGGIVPPFVPSSAQTSLQCQVLTSGIYNRSSISYEVNGQKIEGLSNRVFTSSTPANSAAVVNTSALGIIDRQTNTALYSLGVISAPLTARLQSAGLSRTEAQQGSIAAIQAFAALPNDTSTLLASSTIKAKMVEAVPQKASQINGLADEDLLLALFGGAPETLIAAGVSTEEANNASSQAKGVLKVSNSDTVSTINNNVNQTALAAVTNKTPVTELQNAVKTEFNNLRTGKPSQIKSGSKIQYRFRLKNDGSIPSQVIIPNVQNVQQTGLIGLGNVTSIVYNKPNQTPTEVVNANPSVLLAPQEELIVAVNVDVGNISSQQTTTIGINLGTGCGQAGSVAVAQSLAVIPPLSIQTERALNRITGCSGEQLPDYRNFSIALYDGEGTNRINLTTTEGSNVPNNQIPLGVAPNRDNRNLFVLDNSAGDYNFLLDETKGQLAPGTTYTIQINPAPSTKYSQRQIKIVLGERVGNLINYTATATDNKPVDYVSNLNNFRGTIELISNSEQVGQSLGVLNIPIGICQAQEISLTKSGDRAAAEPGDTVVYRLTVRSLIDTGVNGIEIEDTLPEGVVLQPKSVRGQIDKTAVTLTKVEVNGRKMRIGIAEELKQGQVLNLIYAATLTPDAIRGSGKNLAYVNGRRVGTGVALNDGPAIHRLRIQRGIVSDCGTLIGRVFVDKNFDGEQQQGEPGIPNAVVYTQDGNRITTDANGLFHLANVLPGYYTGVLDLTSVPGYTLAPNLYFNERNSQSRLVHLAPGGMVRMNFAVTPTFQEEAK